MDEQYIKQRIAKLRTEKGISAREMSLQLGQSTGYINSIENNVNLPSMTAFFYICDYFGITPSEFFDETLKYPVQYKNIIGELNHLSPDDCELILNLLKSMNRYHK